MEQKWKKKIDGKIRKSGGKVEQKWNKREK